MRYRVKNPYSITYTFGAFSVPNDESEHDDLPADVLQGMRDAGLTVEAVGDKATPAPAPKSETDDERTGKPTGEDDGPAPVPTTDPNA